MVAQELGGRSQRGGPPLGIHECCPFLLGMRVIELAWNREWHHKQRMHDVLGVSPHACGVGALASSGLHGQSSPGMQ